MLKWILSLILFVSGFCQAQSLWQAQLGFYPKSFHLGQSCEQRFAISQKQLYRQLCQQSAWSAVSTLPELVTDILPYQSTLFAYGSGLHQSKDSGVTWDRVPELGRVFRMFLGLEGQLFAQNDAASLFLTEDGGKSWQPFSSSIGYISVMYRGAASRLFAVTNNGKLWLYQPSTKSWQLQSSDVGTVVALPDGHLISLRFMKQDNSTRWQLFRSVDQGVNWLPLGQSQDAFNGIWPVLLHAAENGDIYIGGSLEFMVRLPANSTDYQYLPKPKNISHQYIGIRQIVTTSQGLYVLTGSNSKQDGVGSRGLFFSGDQGQTWQDLTAGFTDWQKEQLTKFELTSSGELYLQDPTRGIYYKANQQAAWQLLNAELPYAVSGFYRLSATEILAVSLGGVGPGRSYGVWRSLDNGQSWQTAEQGLSEPFNTLSAVTQNAQGDVYVSGYANSTVFRWERQQQRWQALPIRPTEVGGAYTMGALTFFGQQLYAGLYFQGSWRFDSQQQQWSEDIVGLPRRADESIPGIRQMAASTKGLVAFVADQLGSVGLYRKPSLNQPWQVVTADLRPITNVLNSGDDRIIASGGEFSKNSWNYYSYRSSDGGIQWQAIPIPIEGVILAVVTSPSKKYQGYLTKDWLYVEELGSGTYRRFQRPEVAVAWSSLIFLSDSALMLSTEQGLVRLDLSQNSWNQDITLTADLVIDGDLEILGGVVDLNGFSLTVKGHLFQAGGSLKLNRGQLNVQKDYLLKATTDKASSDGVLQMQDINDRVTVGGNFVMDSSSSHSNFLTAGTLEIAGNFSQLNQFGTYGGNTNFAASGSHVVRLTGSQPQVYFYSHWDSGFQHLSVQQLEQVRFVSQYVVKGQQLVWLQVQLSHPQAVVVSEDQQIRCGPLCTIDVAVGTSIRLNAQSNAWVRFKTWNSACGNVAQCQLIVSQGMQIRANYELQSYQAKVLLAEGLQLQQTEYALKAGETLELKPVILAGYRLKNQINGSCPQGKWLTAATYQTGTILSDCTVQFSTEIAKKSAKLPWWLFVPQAKNN